MKNLYPKKLAFLILLSLTLIATTSQANNYYVSNTGNDASDGLTATTPWQTFKISSYARVKISALPASASQVNNPSQRNFEYELNITENNRSTTDTVQVTVLSVAGADNSISSYSWIKISGPAQGTITTPNAATTAVNNLVQGVYKFELTVIDTNGSIAKDTVMITVNGVPVVNAGTDQVITLPTNTITLSGSATDTDGSISNYVWVKIAGPSAGTIATSNTANTSVNGLVQGIYKYELTATDNRGASVKDTIQITVNAAPNQAPSANAGTDNIITLPTNTTTLNGSGTDAEGPVKSYGWLKISGPSSGTIVSANAATTVLNGLAQGIYQYELTVTDSNGATAKDTVKVIVNAAPNQVPVAYTGADQVITLPARTAILSGSGTDIEGPVSGYAWIKISGPATGTVAPANTATATATDLVQGTYKFELTVTDANGAVGKDTIQITVNTASNQLPVANAGADKMITLPVNAVVLAGVGTDADGPISVYAWVQISGPSAGTINGANTATIIVSNLLEGVYQYELTVTDTSKTTGKDTVQVTVLPAVNVAPLASAGADQTITLPINTVSFAGNGTDTDGSITGYGWKKIAGPSAGTIADAANANTNVNELAEGIYQYELTVTDDDGAIAKDTVQVTVFPALNVAPAANAGADVQISLPVRSTELSGGSSTDSDGTISSYLWIKISGPAAGNIATPDAVNTVLNDLAEGIYNFELAVTDDDGATSKDTVQVAVIAAANIAPVANAGVDKEITLPASTSQLSGTASDSDGTISGFAWVKIAGPVSGTILNEYTANPGISDLTQGIYLYELTVTDNSGAIAKDTVQITVLRGANTLPVANAGNDNTITLPVTNLTLPGTATDADGKIAAYAWLKISGPVGGVIETPNTATTLLTGLTAGVYQYELTVTDNDGGIAKDTVQVTVNAATNKFPVANAGSDKTITLPTNTVTLSGIGTDEDGTIVSYSWTKKSGPLAGTISLANSPSPSLTNLVQGIYEYELTVTDNNGATATSTSKIIVNGAANKFPVANTGSDKMITLPTNTVTLTGSGTDEDGTVVSYSWIKKSGPVAGTISLANSTTPSLSNLVQGVYEYELTVTDNSGATATSTSKITVNAAPLKGPIANAGPDKVVTLPATTATLAGSGTVAGGTIVSYSWVRLPGKPATVVSPNTATATVTDLSQPGVYKFQLTVKNNNGVTANDTVIITVNPAPIAHAGPDKVIILPATTATLAGSGTAAGGTIISYSWVRLPGKSATVVSPNSATASVTGLSQPGIYKFQLTVTDNNGVTANDTVVVTVNAAPVANAGPDKVITLPVTTATLTGSGTVAGGTIVNYSWVRLPGKSATVVSPNSATASVTGLSQPGVYKFQLTVKDNNGVTANDTVIITVNPAPVANAGPDKVITLPATTATLAGSGTAAGGTIISYSWVRLPGKSATVVSPNSATASVTGLSQPGIYKFQLTVTDNNGVTANDTVVITVNAVPVANAGADKVITLPVTTATLTGSGTVAGGTIVSYNWVRLPGKSATVVSPNSATASVTDLSQPGIYKFQLTVKDNNGVTANDTVVITVNAVPVANAGADKVITLPVTTATLTGSGTVAGGTIVSYSWVRLPGKSATVVSPNSATATITDLSQPGIYKFQLTVTDNNGVKANDTVIVTVNATPEVNAGPDRVITLPATTATLAGSGTVAGGTIVSYSWVRLPGKSATVVSPNSATASVTDLSQPGVYKFQLTVTDNHGVKANDTVIITVNAAPVANAGADKVITLPETAATLAGSGTVAGGSIISYSWIRLPGAFATVVSPNTATATATGLVPGVYKFQLTVTDNHGVKANDTVIITVNAAPVANAGADKVITLPETTATLAGSGTVAGGSIISYSWIRLPGAFATVVSPNTATATATGLVPGVYKFQLTVTDNHGVKANDTVIITVNSSLSRETTNIHIEKNQLTVVVDNPLITKDAIQVTSKNAAKIDTPIIRNTPPAAVEIKNALRVYPNPVRDIANLEITTASKNKARVSVIDMNGRVVKYAELSNLDKNNISKLDLSNLRNGYYIIVVGFEDGQKLSSKVMKYGGK